MRFPAQLCNHISQIVYSLNLHLNLLNHSANDGTSDDFHLLAINVVAAANMLINNVFEEPTEQPSKSPNSIALKVAMYCIVLCTWLQNTL